MKTDPVLLSFGGNLGDSAAIFTRALRSLSGHGFELKARSSMYHSKALGCEPGASDFCNLSVLGKWNGTPEELLDLCQKLETEAGRPAVHPHWVSRTLDIDIILMGELVMKTDRLTIPHPEMLKRDFVLVPSAEIAADMGIPGTGTTIGAFLK